MGSALSPNGISFSEEGVLSLALMDGILSVDKQRMQVRSRQCASASKTSHLVNLVRGSDLGLCR